MQQRNQQGMLLHVLLFKGGRAADVDRSVDVDLGVDVKLKRIAHGIAGIEK